jgi:hypothetical protein
MVSVISMLADPNDESPANLDAAVCWHFLPSLIDENNCSECSMTCALDHLDVWFAFTPATSFEITSHL